MERRKDGGTERRTDGDHFYSPPPGRQGTIKNHMGEMLITMCIVQAALDIIKWHKQNHYISFTKLVTTLTQ